MWIGTNKNSGVQIKLTDEQKAKIPNGIISRYDWEEIQKPKEKAAAEPEMAKKTKNPGKQKAQAEDSKAKSE